MNISAEYVMINGERVAAELATISIHDRGLRFGDGVFETIPVVHGIPYLWEAHIVRLQAGLEAIMINADCTTLHEHTTSLIAHNRITQGMVRIMITRGQGSQGYLPTYATPPTIIIEATPTDAACAAHHTPMTLSVSSFARLHPASLPTHAKLMQGLNPTLARLHAQKEGCDEALMLDIAGNISEAASGNLIWQKDNVLYAADTHTGCLSGTMVARLRQIINAPIHSVSMPLEGLQHCDALIMTNALKGAVAISKVKHAQNYYHFSMSEPLADVCNSAIQKDIAEYTTSA
jgi:branched-subunit amino acid aminotransferase/4-amino-4-deoxychorismate lyase